MLPTARSVAALFALCVPLAAHAGEVTIYRCTDAKGHLSLRDSPCRKGETQQARTMTRPVDPPPWRAPGRSEAPQQSRPPPLRRVVYSTPPRPLYECVTPDGDRYTSDTGAGNPRFVPAWTVGYPVYPVPPRGNGGGGWRIDAGSGRTRIHVGRPDRYIPPVIPAYAAGLWVRDECHELPTDLVCDRLRDQRYALDRRYNSALQSERTRITTEQRDIDARLANDCGDNG